VDFLTGGNFAGTQWRSEVCFLQDQKLTFHEGFPEFSFTAFDGSRVVMKRRAVAAPQRGAWAIPSRSPSNVYGMTPAHG
jgi:hypothetical protein